MCIPPQVQGKNLATLRPRSSFFPHPRRLDTWTGPIELPSPCLEQTDDERVRLSLDFDASCNARSGGFSVARRSWAHAVPRCSSLSVGTCTPSGVVARCRPVLGGAHRCLPTIGARRERSSGGPQPHVQARDSAEGPPSATAGMFSRRKRVSAALAALASQPTSVARAQDGALLIRRARREDAGCDGNGAQRQ